VRRLFWAEREYVIAMSTAAKKCLFMFGTLSGKFRTRVGCWLLVAGYWLAPDADKAVSVTNEPGRTRGLTSNQKQETGNQRLLVAGYRLAPGADKAVSVINEHARSEG
jgi:hypothetical protein